MPTPQTATLGASIALRPVPAPRPSQNGLSASAVPASSQAGYPSGSSGSAVQGNQTASPTLASVTANAGATTNTPAKNRLWTSHRANLGLTVMVSAFAVAAYVAQLRGNWLSSMANKIAEKVYKDQIWKDCRDRRRTELPDLPCHAQYKLRLISATFSQAAVFSRPDCTDDVSTVDFLMFLTSRPCSATSWPTDLTEWSKLSSMSMTTFLWRWSMAITSNVFVGMFVCHIIFLSLLRDLWSRRKQKWLTRRKPGRDTVEMNLRGASIPRGLLAASRLEIVSGLVLPLTAAFPMLGLTVGLQTGFAADLACGVALVLLFATYCILEFYAQRIRTRSFQRPDEEIQEEYVVPESGMSIPEVTLALLAALPSKTRHGLRRRKTGTRLITEGALFTKEHG